MLVGTSTMVVASDGRMEKVLMLLACMHGWCLKKSWFCWTVIVLFASLLTLLSTITKYKQQDPPRKCQHFSSTHPKPIVQQNTIILARILLLPILPNTKCPQVSSLDKGNRATVKQLLTNPKMDRNIVRNVFPRDRFQRPWCS